MIHLNDIFKHGDNIVTRKVMDETLLVPIRGDIASMDNIFTLNNGADFIWSQLDGNHTLHSIARKMANKYDAPRATIENDMRELVTGLSEAGLLRCCTNS